MSGTTASTGTAAGAALQVRRIEPGDGEECARIVYEAFGGIHEIAGGNDGQKRAGELGFHLPLFHIGLIDINCHHISFVKYHLAPI